MNLYQIIRIHGAIGVPDYLRWEVNQLLSSITTEPINEVTEIAPGRHTVCVSDEKASNALKQAENLIDKYIADWNTTCQHN